MKIYHKAALVDEVITFLKVEPGKKYIDATIGGGGHTSKILEKGGIVLGIDRDQDALDYAKSYLHGYLADRLLLVKSSFSEIAEIARLNNFTDVNGILFDLGVSSYQLDTPSRGFSYKFDSELDMRMDQNSKLTAAEIIKRSSQNQLIDLFRKYGETQYAVQIVREIVKMKHQDKILTSGQLRKVIKSVYDRKHANNKPNKIFQALRIAVNDELNELKKGLADSLPLISKGGRLIIISYHSLEDRIVKLMFRSENLKNILTTFTKRPIRPQFQEIKNNPRVKSAKMRVFEKV